MQNHHVLLVSAAIFVFASGSTYLSSRRADPQPRNPSGVSGSEAEAVVAFWREAGPGRWFAKDPEFDRTFRDRFLVAHEAAARGELASWSATADGSLALVILLDQFPRNAFRDTARMYATDAQARAVADAAIAAKQDLYLDKKMRLFLYLPFGHSEDLADQERSVDLARARLEAIDLKHAEHHRDIVRQFGRFPHRNAVLGRPTTPAEQAWLDAGGFKG